MSLKFALASLTFLGTPGPRARADDQSRNLGPIGPYEPVLITFGRKRNAAEPRTPEAGGSVKEGEAQHATLNSTPQKSSGVDDA